MQELLESQRGLICEQTGHELYIALPVQKDDDLCRVLCRCITCGRDFWEVLPKAGYGHFLADLAAGKIK